MYESEKFNKYVRSLITVIKSILAAEAQASFIINPKEDPVFCGFELYKSLLESSVESRYQDFVDCYNHHKRGILADLPTCLTTGGIYVCPSQGVYIDLSAVYKMGVGIKKSIDSRYSAFGNSVTKKDPETLFPLALQLHLCRIFSLVAEEGELVTMKSKIASLEVELGIGDQSKFGVGAGQIPQDLGPVMNMATQFMGKMGVPPPKEGQAPSQEDFTRIFGSIMSNPKIKDTFADLTNDVNSGKGFESIIAKLMTTFTDPELTGALSGTLKPTVDAAIAGRGGNGDLHEE